MTRSRFALPIVSAALAAAAMLAPTSAHAQQPPAPAAAGAAAGGTDHAQVSGSFGVGYLGLGGLAVGANNGTTLSIPTVGVRYWLSDSMGIDAGLGFGMTSGESKSKAVGGGTTTETTTEDPSTLGVGLHAGVPLVMASGQHHTFQVVPELNLAFGSRSGKTGGQNGQPTTTTDDGGFHLDLGARAGTEIHFGFIGLPKLSLQATIGLRVNYDSVSTKVKTDGAAATENENSRSTLSLSTNVQNAPWAIFTNTISALYYF